MTTPTFGPVARSLIDAARIHFKPLAPERAPRPPVDGLPWLQVYLSLEDALGGRTIGQARTVREAIRVALGANVTGLRGEPVLVRPETAAPYWSLSA